MSAFGGLVLTTKGRNLQAKAQAGAQLNFTRIGVGDGELAGSSILELNALKNEVKTLSITKLKPLTGGKAAVGGTLSNQGLVSGFYWRELGLFAQDPDLGEILYCYGNSGANAEYIPADGGPDVLEKSIDIISIVGNAANVTATIEQSLVFATPEEVDAKITESETAVRTLTNKTLATPKITGNVLDSNGNELLGLGTTANAVNYARITNAATGNEPGLQATGDDADVSMQFTAKGLGVMKYVIGNAYALIIEAVASAKNYLRIKATATTVAPTIEAVSSTDANVDINIIPKGTGVVKANGKEVALKETVDAHLAETTTTATQPHGLAKNKLDAITAPTVNDDSGDGYSVNSIWIDTTNDKAYICLDATVGAAIWRDIYSSNAMANSIVRDLSVAGVQTVILGFKPKAIFIFGAVTNTNKMSMGVKGTGQGQINSFTGGIYKTYGSGSLYFMADDTNATLGAITITDTGFDITWTKGGTGAGGTAGMYYIAI
jgi:hypothetical protein